MAMRRPVAYLLAILSSAPAAAIAQSVTTPAPATTPSPAQPPVPAVAQTPPSPEALKAASELVAILAKDSLGQDPGKAWPAVEARIAAAKLDKDTLAALRAEFERIQKQRLNDLMTDEAAIYARHFSAPELRDLAAFYRTTTGQKALKELARANVEYARLVSSRMQEVQAETFLAFRKVLRERGVIERGVVK